MSICVLGYILGENGLASREVELPCVCCGGSDGEEEGEGAPQAGRSFSLPRAAPAVGPRVAGRQEPPGLP